MLIIITAGGAVLARMGGEWLGRRQASAARSSSLQTFLEENVRGLGQGVTFPGFPVWSQDGSAALPAFRGHIEI